MPCQLKIEPNICSCDYDGIILVSGCAPGYDEPEPFKTVLFSAAQIDSALGVIGAVLPINLPAKRLIYSPTGPLNMDYHDVRSFAEAATKGVKRYDSINIISPSLFLSFSFSYYIYILTLKILKLFFQLQLHLSVCQLYYTLRINVNKYQL